jgi:CHAD domain-containing protein
VSKTTTPSPFSVRELARKRFDSLQKCLKAHPEDVNAAVHNARRDLKKLRALLRLIRPMLGEDDYHSQNACLRSAGRLMAPLRDAWARLLLIQNMCEELNTGPGARGLEIAADRLRNSYEETLRDHPPERILPEVAEQLAATRKLSKEWPEPDGVPLTFSFCAKGLHRSYQRSRERLLRNLANPTSSNLHEWRKCCKDLRYQLEFLDTACQKAFRPTTVSLRDLTDSLGKNHDLSVLRETLESEVRGELSKTQLLVLHDTLEVRQRTSMDASLTLGFQFFSPRPKHFCAELESIWEQVPGPSADAPDPLNAKRSGSPGNS